MDRSMNSYNYEPIDPQAEPQSLVDWVAKVREFHLYKEGANAQDEKNKIRDNYSLEFDLDIFGEWQ